MSYDIRITKSDDPEEQPVDQIDVRQFIEAFNAFPAIQEAGITWSGDHWADDSLWGGTAIYFAGYDAPIDERERDGSTDACDFHITYGNHTDFVSCFHFAVYIASAVGAKAWDLQLDTVLRLSEIDASMARFKKTWKPWSKLFGK